MEQKKIGLFMKELRKEKKLTQEQLAEILGVTNRSISRWENGINMPGIDLVIEIADYFDVSIEELLDGERRTDMVDKKTEEVLLKAAEYSNSGYLSFSKKQRRLYLIALAAFAIYGVLEMQGLTDTGVYGAVSNFALGIVLGALIMGVLFTTKYMEKICTLKHRILHKN